jgi:hypothetical protein
MTENIVHTNKCMCYQTPRIFGRKTAECLEIDVYVTRYTNLAHKFVQWKLSRSILLVSQAMSSPAVLLCV